jgi:hypothetical protein
MYRSNIVWQIGRVLMAVTLAVAVVSTTSTGTAYAKHNNAAAIALGILGGALAGAAIASGAPPAYVAPPVYGYPYPPPTVHYYGAPAAAYYRPMPYGSGYYYGGY